MTPPAPLHLFFILNKLYLSVPPLHRRSTASLSLFVSNPKHSPYLQASKRELLADYALPCAVILLSFIGSYFFSDIPGKCEGIQLREESHFTAHLSGGLEELAQEDSRCD